MKSIERLIRRGIWALSRPGYPPDCLVHHLGVHLGRVGEFNVQVAAIGGLQVHASGRADKTYSDRIFKIVLQECERALNVVPGDVTNIEDHPTARTNVWWGGPHWITVNFDAPTPEGLSIATVNYHELVNVFAPHTERYRAFHNLFDRYMREVEQMSDDELRKVTT